MDEDYDAPVSEPSVAESEDSDEDEWRVKKPKIVTAVGRDQLRKSLKQSRKIKSLPEPSPEKEKDIVKEVESRLKRARVNVSELLHDAFIAKAARSQEKQWHGLNGREKLLFLKAVSKQRNAWQENAAATVIPPTEAKVIWRALKETGFARPCHPITIYTGRQKTKAKAQPRKPLDTKGNGNTSYRRPRSFGEL